MEAPSQDIVAATLRGVRSLNILGWMAEECESAALERLVRQPCLTAARAYFQGRNAAVDEMRTLTGHRRRIHYHTVAWPTDLDGDSWEPGVDEPGYEIVEQTDLVARWADKQANRATVTAPRIAQIGVLASQGLTNREIAAEMGIDPTRISQLLSKKERQRPKRPKALPLPEQGRLDPSLIPHGTRSGFQSWLCRCDACCDAERARKRANYARKNAVRRQYREARRRLVEESKADMAMMVRLRSMVD